MTKMMIFSILLALLIASSISAQGAFAANTSPGNKEVQFLIKKITAAYGGEKAIGETKTVYAVGHIIAFMRQDWGSYELYFNRPRKLRVETKYRHSFETRILNGDIGYRGTDEEPLSQVRDYRFLAMVYQYKHFDLPHGLLSGHYKVSIKGKEHLHGEPVVIVHLMDNEGPPMDVFVDTVTFFIVKVTGYFTVVDGRTAILSSEFSDFRKVGDTVFPFKVTYYAADQLIAEATMMSYKINPHIPDSIFSPGSSGSY